MKKLQVWWPLFFALTMIAGMFIGYRLRKNIPETQGFFGSNKATSLQEVMTLVKTKYVDSVNTDSLTEDAIQAMMEKLDPHTIYIPNQLTAVANEDINGNFEGIGVEYYIINDTINAVNVLQGGPSDVAGVKIGDKFIQVDDSVVAGTHISSEKIRKLLRGESGTSVNIKLLRGKNIITTTVKRGTIPRYAVDAAYMMDDQTGFIHLNKFSRTSYEEFMQALEKLQKQGLKKLILDVRGNGGGILDEAVDIADEFLDGEKLVVYTQGVHSERREYRCKRPGLFEKGELVLLVDEFSASATEVLAGALQDWDRAMVVGRRTFGKGLVQEPFLLSDGSQLRLTIARYYTPAGRNIQKPFAKNHEEYSEEVYDRFYNGQSSSEDTSKHTGPAYKTLVKKRTVYGGGGITPDVFVAFDTTRLPTSIAGVFGNRQIFSKFVYDYFLQNQDYFNQFKTPRDFAQKFVTDPSIGEKLINYSRRDSVNISLSNPKDLEEVNKRFKTYMAMQIWRTEGYYELNNQYDSVVRKAVEAIRNN